MLVLISNRNINQGKTDENLFGDGINPDGIDRLRLAIANYNDDTNQWHLDLKPKEDAKTPPPSKQLFDAIVSKTRNPELEPSERLHPHWVYYIHGFNKDMRDLLEECLHLEDAFRVNILAFAWPSNPGGMLKSEFPEAKKIAQKSISAFDRSLEILQDYLTTGDARAKKIVPTLLVHSLGNLLLENWVRSNLFDQKKIGIFRNTILHQAAVKASEHAEWVDRMKGTRVYITLNNRDEVLRGAQILGGLQLGQADKGLKAKKPIYINFTGARNIRGKHNIYRFGIANLSIHAFCRESLKGREGEDLDGFEFVPDPLEENVLRPKD